MNAPINATPLAGALNQAAPIFRKCRTFTAAVLLSGFAFSPAKADEELDINTLVAAGHLGITNSSIDIGSIDLVFDGDTGTLARSASINPLVITFSFDHPRTISRLRTWFLAGANRWRADAADSLADLDAGTGSFAALVDWTTEGEQTWSEQAVASFVPRSILRFQLERLLGDDYVHLNELEIYAGPVPLQITDMQLSGSDLSLEWSCEPDRWYCVQHSADLSTWIDVEFCESSAYSAQWSGTLPETTPPRRFWRVRTAAPEERAIVTKRVLVLNFDPILESRGGQRLSSYPGWNDPALLTATYLSDLETASDNHVDWEITQFLTIDEFPPKLVPAGWRYTDASYLDALEGGGTWHSPDNMDYDWLISTPVTSFACDVAPLAEFGDRNLSQLVDDGLIDEVILWGGPYFGYYESRMIGKTAYWCNSPGINIPGIPLYVVMGLNYEREPSEALHSFGHRAESIMTHVYGSWSGSSQSNHLWDEFTRVKALHGTGISAVGTIHYPPNGLSDYDYDNPAGTMSTAPDWLDNYPDLQGTTAGVDNNTWTGGLPEFNPQHSYLHWWLSHIPHQPGLYIDSANQTNDGKLNNWWGYIIDMNTYTESR